MTDDFTIIDIPDSKKIFFKCNKCNGKPFKIKDPFSDDDVVCPECKYSNRKNQILYDTDNINLGWFCPTCELCSSNVLVRAYGVRCDNCGSKYRVCSSCEDRYNRNECRCEDC